MLKERDKKLLFYSWSYALLAVCIIYACCGFGALAYDLKGTTIVSGDSSQVNARSQIWLNYTNDWTTVTKIEFDNTGTSVGGSFNDWKICTASHAQIGTISGSFSGSTAEFFTNFTGNPEGSNNYATSQANCGSGPETITGFQIKVNTPTYEPQNTPYGFAFSYPGGSYPGQGTWRTYGGSDLPDAPVINDFTKDASCYHPGEAIVFESNVTGTVDSWLWEIYDSSDVQKWSSTDSIETIMQPTTVLAPGLYQVQLYVENTGGNDFLSKDNWLNITQSGTCLPLQNWSPFPTQTTIVPTQVVYPIITQPSYTVINLTGINSLIDNDPTGLGNLSKGYRSTVDYYAEGLNSTFTGTLEALFSPFSTIVNGLATAISLFSSSMTALQVYTTVPLAITAIVINYMPWQIVTLITAGIAIDAIFIILIGR